MSERCELRLPDLGLSTARWTLSVWLVAPGSEVFEGDRLAQIVSGEICVDLPAPCCGRVVEQCAAEDEEVQVGQLLGIIER